MNEHIEYTDIEPAQARRLLERADRLSRAAHNAARWPYITFILALGTATSFGTLAMGLTTGRAFGLSYFGTLTVGIALVVLFTVSIRDHASFARSRRWTLYIASWFAAYAAAIAVVAWVHGSVLWSGVTSGLVLAVAMASAAREARA